MSFAVLIIFCLVLVVIVFGVATLMDIPSRGGTGNVKGNIRAIVSAQRDSGEGRSDRGRRSIIETAKESGVKRTAGAKISLEKRLRYAQWSMSPALYHTFEAIIALIAFGFAATVVKLNIIMQTATLLVGPLVMSWFLERSIQKRFNLFDADYPQFLLSLAGLLKTGMNPMSGIEAAAAGMDEGSLIRSEILLMLERLKYGVSEDASIGSFGEDIAHPEIELFVQALLLSRRVGGTLSDTLDRLAKQVRKRQYFRRQAIAAVSMQRGSIKFILGIMIALEVYLYLIYPVAVMGAINDPMGWQVWQGGIGVILVGIYWVRQVTKIKV